MGFMDKVKDSVKSADEKLGNAIDKEKLDSEIRKLEKEIEETVKEIGQKVLEVLKDGKTAAEADVASLYDKVKELETKIADLKNQKDDLGKKE